MSELKVVINAQSAREALYRFCRGKERMCVPARKDDDDALIADALDELERLQTDYNEAVAVIKFYADESWYEFSGIDVPALTEKGAIARNFIAKHKEATGDD